MGLQSNGILKLVLCRPVDHPPRHPEIRLRDRRATRYVREMYECVDAWKVSITLGLGLVRVLEWAKGQVVGRRLHFLPHPRLDALLVWPATRHVLPSYVRSSRQKS